MLSNKNKQWIQNDTDQHLLKKNLSLSCCAKNINETLPRTNMLSTKYWNAPLSSLTTILTVSGDHWKRCC